MVDMQRKACLVALPLSVLLAGAQTTNALSRGARPEHRSHAVAAVLLAPALAIGGATVSPQAFVREPVARASWPVERYAFYVGKGHR